MTDGRWAAALLGLALMAAPAAAAADDVQGLDQVAHIHALAVDPADPDRLYMATHHGLYVVDGGTAERISDTRADLMSFAPHPADPSVMFASGHPPTGGNLGVLRSDDAGRTWAAIAQGVNGPVDFHALTVSPADPDVLYGLYGGIQMSRDGGETWTVQGPAPAQIFDLAASSADPDRLFAATRGGLLVSADAGRTWQPATALAAPASTVHVAADGTVSAFVVGTGLIRAEEPGGSWSLVAAPDRRVLLHLTAAPGDPDRLYAVDGDGALLRSTDGGRTWQPLSA